MKTMCPAHHNGFVATHALGHMNIMCSLPVHMCQSHCGDNGEGIYIYMRCLLAVTDDI